MNIFTLEKSALLNLLTHRQKKVAHIAIINRMLMRGVIMNPFTSNATPAFNNAETGILSICRVINLNAAVVYVNGLRYTNGNRIPGNDIVGM